jgi:hypothetical protein
MRDLNRLGLTAYADAMREHARGVAAATGGLAPLAVAAILVPFRSVFASAAAAVVLLAVVVAVAALGNRVAGFIATLSSCLWFDLFLTRPYERLAITHRADIETAIALLVVGFAVTELAARGRANRRSAVEESRYLALLYELSELAASGAAPEHVTTRAAAALCEVLHLRGCRYEAAALERSAPGRAVLGHDGRVRLGSVVWGVHQMGLPGRELELAIGHHGEVVGRFVLEPTPGWPLSAERRIAAVAIADQAGAAMPSRLRSA